MTQPTVPPPQPDPAAAQTVVFTPDPGGDPAAPPAPPKPCLSGYHSHIPMAPTAMILRWFAEAANIAGNPISVSITDYVRRALVHLPTGSVYRGWCDLLHANTPTKLRDNLGTYTVAEVRCHGWEIHLMLVHSTPLGVPQDPGPQHSGEPAAEHRISRAVRI